jgi:hypothetical protein
MDQDTLVEMLKDDGQRLIDRLIEEGVGVSGACWLKEAENGLWFLYIATPLVDEGGATLAAYRRVNAVQRNLQQPLSLDPLLIRLVGPDSPVSQAVQEVHRRYPGRTPTHVGGTRFGGVSVEGVYVYPPSPAVAR